MVDIVDSVDVLTARRENDLGQAMFAWVKRNPKATIKDGEFAGWNLADAAEVLKERYASDTEMGLQQYASAIQTLLRNTDYYRDTEEGRALKESEWYAGDDSESWTTRRESLVAADTEIIERIAGELQLNWEEDQILELAKIAWLSGWTEDQIYDFLEESGDLKFGVEALPGSTIAIDQATMAGEAQQYFVDYDPSEYEKFQRASLRGEATAEQWTNKLANEAARLYPSWAADILAGQTPMDIMNSYNQVFYRRMGYMPDWGGNDNDWVMKFGSYADPNGSPMTISGWDASLAFMNSPQGDKAMPQVLNAYSLVNDLGQAMGVIG